MVETGKRRDRLPRRRNVRPGALAGEFGMTRNDTISFIVREWMEKNTYLAVHEVDEDGDVDGNA
ncbi:UNVERIFIED_ORG: hypothetical protein M2312_003685 [Rhizobium esperanzae]|uniref:CopG family transcriptional regulator n=1 Tax=Rhizobium phaseoli TaxID=396 RepID=A0ABM6C6R2_9HYPH|nr:hypothetical protein AMC88_CH01151 [Rhizobium phaseoli]MDH6649025.1 hypothetical protein [Rhizobium esperanzae]ANL52285.1 hypothetical protein AMC86_CH01106 [Rhizobium phaseoli]ANL58568.1 hypothetical protein AMC85_CH01151 [Rhizobium phaseoli]ANL83899.1 hypothetical protein AMC81_CH01088 [Rhizobium phaseoli]